MVEGNREKRRMKKGENKRGKKRKRSINIILYAFFHFLNPCRLEVSTSLKIPSFFVILFLALGFRP